MAGPKITEDCLALQRQLVEQRYINARNAGKEGKGTHRNCGDAGRVAALWMEAKRELAEMERHVSAQEWERREK